MTIGKRIKDLMLKRKVSNKELSSEIGVPASTISQWTNYDQTPGPEALLRASKYLGVSMEYLITGEEPENIIANALMKGLEDSWTEIHQGVYRIKVEKKKI